MAVRNAFTVVPGGTVVIPPGSVGSSQLADNSVSNAKLGPNSVTTDKVLDGTLTGNDMAINSIPADRLLDGSIDPAKLGPGSIPKSKLGPLGIVDADVTGPISGAKISTPVKQEVQFNGAAVPVETILNFIGTAGLLDVADEPAQSRTNINLQGIITSQPPKGTDGQVRSVGGNAGNTVGVANSWAGADHTHYLLLIPISGNPALIPFSNASGTLPDLQLVRTGTGSLAVQTAPSAGGTFSSRLQVAQDGVTTVSGPGSALVLEDRTLGASNVHYLFRNNGAFTILQSGIGNRMVIGSNGAVAITPDAGQPALVLSGSPEATLNPSGGQHLTLGIFGSYALWPAADSAANLGGTSRRWIAVYATNGTIQTSAQEAKSNVQTLDSEEAITAIRQTEAVSFDYKSPPLDVPLDPEEAETYLNMRSEQAKVAHQAGFVAEQAHPLFVTGGTNTNPSNSVGVLLAAIRQMDARIQQLEAV